MKKLNLILFTMSFLALMSCNSNTSKEETKSSNSSNSNTYSTKYLSVELGDDWTVNDYGANNKNQYSIFSFKVNNSGNIYNDFNQDLEQIGDVTETTVDGMPAITRKQKFTQNEVKFSRVWLIYDGENIISFNVAAPEHVFDDAIAQSIVLKVKILHKGENVQLPVKKKNEFSKPDVFPAKTLNKLKDDLSTNSLLSEKSINNAIDVITSIRNINTTNIKNSNEDALRVMSDSIAITYGFNNFVDLLNKTLKPATSCAAILNMIKNSESKNSDITSFLKDFISQNKVSSADLKFTYEHWDLIMKLYNLYKKK